MRNDSPHPPKRRRYETQPQSQPQPQPQQPSPHLFFQPQQQSSQQPTLLPPPPLFPSMNLPNLNLSSMSLPLPLPPFPPPPFTTTTTTLPTPTPVTTVAPTITRPRTTTNPNPNMASQLDALRIHRASQAAQKPTSTTFPNNNNNHPALRTIIPVAEALSLISPTSQILSALTQLVSPYLPPHLHTLPHLDQILSFRGFPPSSNPNFYALLLLSKSDLDILAWVFVVSKHGRKDDVAKKIIISLRAPLKFRNPPANRRPISLRNRTPLPSANSLIPTPSLPSYTNPSSNRSRSNMPSLTPAPVSPTTSARNNLMLQQLERQIHPISSSRRSPYAPPPLASRIAPALNRNKQVRDLCNDMLSGYSFKTPENPFNEPLNAPLGAKNYIVFSSVQLSRGNADPALIFPTPPPIDPIVRPVVAGGDLQIHLRCLRVEVEKARTEWKQAWPFPAACRVNGHTVTLNQAQRYTNGKLAGLDTATNISPYLRKYKTAMSESNRVTLRRQSSTATPASGQFVLFAQEVLVHSQETMTKKVHQGSEKYWIEHRRALEKKGTIQRNVSQFEMARQGVVMFLTDPDGLTVSSMKVSLRCPLALTRITTPVKGRRCQHVQCFDLINFLEYSRRSSKFDCPVCNKATAFPSMLVISPYIEHALETYKDCDEVEIFQDGSMVAVERKQTGVASDDDDDNGPSGPPNGLGHSNAKSEVVDLTLDSDEEELPAAPSIRESHFLRTALQNGHDGSQQNLGRSDFTAAVEAPHVADEHVPVNGDIGNDLSQLDQDIDFTFQSNFVPWGDTSHAIAVDLAASAARLPPPPSGGNGNGWGAVDVIAIDSD